MLGGTETMGSFQAIANQNWREMSSSPAPGRFTEQIHRLCLPNL